MSDSTTDWVEEDLALDLRAYGTCYWKMVDGKKVRVHPHDIHFSMYQNYGAVISGPIVNPAPSR